MLPRVLQNAGGVSSQRFSLPARDSNEDIQVESFIYKRLILHTFVTLNMVIYSSQVFPPDPRNHRQSQKISVSSMHCIYEEAL